MRAIFKKITLKNPIDLKTKITILVVTQWVDTNGKTTTRS
jgi:hypothetical protein